MKAKEDLARYREFLMTVPLAQYREKYLKTKWVEQDLPKGMQPLASIYKYYWEERNFLDFDTWFSKFWAELHGNPESLKIVQEFKKYFFDKDNNGWFKKGFEARMNRTWIALLTQLDFCYMLAYISEKLGKNLVLECNAELDSKNIDVKIGDIGFQVAKISQRKEARGGKSKKKGKIEVFTIPYPVYNLEEFKRKLTSPRVSVESKQAYKNALDSFYKYLEIFKNGFVVFGENYINPIVKNITDIEKLKEVINKISLEIGGE